METGMNTLQDVYKIYNFTLPVSSIADLRQCYLQFGMTVADSLLQCVRFMHNFRRRSPNVCLSSFVGNFLTGLRAENLLDFGAF